MSADTRQLAMLVRQLQKAGADMNAVRREIVQKEGQSVVTRAKTICTREKIIDTGNLRNSFHAEEPQISDTSMSIVVANNADYASHVEYGHIVVVRGRRYAMSNGHYVKGRYVLSRAVEGTLRTQESRIIKRLRRIYENK